MTPPAQFTEQMQRLLGADECAALLAALGGEPAVSVRFNPEKWNAPLPGEAVPWCGQGRYLASRPLFTADPLLHAGAYYVQEAASMFLEQILARYVTQPVRMLDLCAAPGGKSTHAISLLPPGSLMVCNEVMRQRSQVLCENVQKWGNPAAVVTQNDPADFAAALPAFFDVVLVDAPCSGEGMFRKDEGAVAQWSPANVELCRQRQRRILADAWATLRPGGLLVYSTCTFNTAEDEENLLWMSHRFAARPLPLNLPAEWNITGDLSGNGLPVFRFLPHKTRGEGLFMAALRKPADADAAAPASASASLSSTATRRPLSRSAAKGGRAAQPLPSSLADWIDAPSGQFLLQMQGDSVVALPAAHVAAIEQLRRSLRLLSAGVPMATLKGRDALPAHPLAMSTLLRRDAFAAVELDRPTALAYLRREALPLLPGVPSSGFCLLTYRGLPLGFAKVAGNRLNNLYPQEWRIRSRHIGDSAE